MMPIQIILVAFFLVAAIKVFFRFKSGEISQFNAGLWILFWMFASVVVVKPNITSSIAKIFGVGRGADIIIYLSLAIIFAMIFGISVKLEKIDREITKITRRESVEKVEKN